jgi:hypothetical protein
MANLPLLRAQLTSKETTDPQEVNFRKRLKSNPNYAIFEYATKWAAIMLILRR